MKDLKKRDYIEKYFLYSLDIKLRILKKDLQLQLRKILMEKRNLYFLYFRKNEIEFIENKNIWVTPSLPLIVFIFIGYIISILYGDVLKFFKFQF